MKRGLLIALVALLFSATSVCADDYIDWSKVGYVRDKSTGYYVPPDNVTYLTDETILPLEPYTPPAAEYFDSYILNLCDEDENVKYTLYPSVLEKGSALSGGDAAVTVPLTSENMSISLKYSGTTLSKRKVSDLGSSYSRILCGRILRLGVYENENAPYLKMELICGETPNITALYDSDTHYLTVSAQCAKWYDSVVNVSVLSGGKAVYVNQLKAVNGTACCEFELKEDVAECALLVSDEYGAYESGIKVYASGKTPLAALSVSDNGDGFDITLDANNAFYGANASHYVVAAFYSADNSLLSVKISKCRQKAISVRKPQGTAKFKAFVLENFESVEPLTVSEQLELTDLQE